MKRIVFVLSALLFATLQILAATPSIPEIDRIRIAEAYRIGERLQDQLWPGWSSAPFSMLFITEENEFLIRHPKPSNDFESIGYDKLLKSEIFARPRKFQKDLLATFPVFGTQPVIVIGKAENTTDKTSTRWVFVVLHEHFHQLQYSRPEYYREVNELGLANGDTSGMWQITYPFPYKEVVVADEFRKLTDSLLKAYEATSNVERTQTLDTFLAERKQFAALLKPDDYKYASFQLWQEGIARYTQYRMAELAARKAMPSPAFRLLLDYTPFGIEADRLIAGTLNEMRELDLAKWERTVFYPVGAIEGILLDRINPDWRSEYLNQKFALEKFYDRRPFRAKR